MCGVQLLVDDCNGSHFGVNGCCGIWTLDLVSETAVCSSSLLLDFRSLGGLAGLLDHTGRMSWVLYLLVDDCNGSQLGVGRSSSVAGFGA